LERRQPWYRAPVFSVTLAVITLVVTLAASWNRLEEGWARDDLQRFTAKLRAQTDQLALVTGAGTKQAPGFSTVADFTSGKLKAKDLASRAGTWSSKLQQISTQISAITVGKLPSGSPSNGEPANNVGGRVPMLSSIRDAYAAAISFYLQAASTYQDAAAETSKSQAQKLVSLGDNEATAGAAAIDAAAGMLARLYVHYDLDARVPMPGESSNAYSLRATSAASTGAGSS
jgi:hypothetical protein